MRPRETRSWTTPERPQSLKVMTKVAVSRSNSRRGRGQPPPSSLPLINTDDWLSDWYYLDSRLEPRATLSLEDVRVPFWKRVVAQTNRDGAYVSTVFLRLDHSFGRGDGRPVLFESLGHKRGYEVQKRCCTFREAIRMHMEVLKELIDNERLKEEDLQLALGSHHGSGIGEP